MIQINQSMYSEYRGFYSYPEENFKKENAWIFYGTTKLPPFWKIDEDQFQHYPVEFVKRFWPGLFQICNATVSGSTRIQELQRPQPPPPQEETQRESIRKPEPFHTPIVPILKPDENAKKRPTQKGESIEELKVEILRWRMKPKMEDSEGIRCWKTSTNQFFFYELVFSFFVNY